jgi:hypothetical protein
MHPKAIFTGLLIHTAVFLFPQVPPELKESLGQPGWNARFFQYLQELESYSEVQSFLGELIKADTLRKEKMPIRLFYYLMGEEAYRTGDWNLARHYWEFGSRESDLPSLFYRRLADLEIREGYFEDALSWIYLLEASADPEFKELGGCLSRAGPLAERGESASWFSHGSVYRQQTGTGSRTPFSSPYAR